MLLAHLEVWKTLQLPYPVKCLQLFLSYEHDLPCMGKDSHDMKGLVYFQKYTRGNVQEKHMTERQKSISLEQRKFQWNSNLIAFRLTVRLKSSFNIFEKKNH